MILARTAVRLDSQAHKAQDQIPQPPQIKGTFSFGNLCPVTVSICLFEIVWDFPIVWFYFSSKKVCQVQTEPVLSNTKSDHWKPTFHP